MNSTLAPNGSALDLPGTREPTACGRAPLADARRACQADETRLSVAARKA